MADTLLALTFIQPWATAALTIKPVENRPVAPPKRLVGHRFAVHAGLRFDDVDLWGLRRHLEGVDLGDIPQGALLGTVKLIGYVKVDEDGDLDFACGLNHAQINGALASKWRAPGARFLWALADPLVLEEPIPCRGKQGMWRVPAEHVPALLAADGRPFVMGAGHG